MKKPSESIPRLADLISLMERLAPPCLAEEWDNCGLQIGSGDWPIRSIWVALDPLPAVVKAASENNIDLIITHHPLFFRPLKQIDLAGSPGRIIETAVKTHTAIYSAHTNLDSTHEGINDVLARMIGMKETQALIPVGNDVEIDGQTRNGRLIGLGRIGKLKDPCSALALAEKLKTWFGLKKIRLAGCTNETVARVAVCSGAGGSLMQRFLESDADLFISGDLRYHDARTVEEAGRALIDIGHFASERIIIDTLVEKIATAGRRAGWAISVEPCRLEQDPFEMI